MELSSKGIHPGHYSATDFLIQEDIMKLTCQECGSLALIIIFLYGFLIGVLETFFRSSGRFAAQICKVVLPSLPRREGQEERLCKLSSIALIFASASAFFFFSLSITSGFAF